MNKELIPNEKQLAARIEKAESRVDRSLKTFIDDCIFLGEEIIEVRKNIPHGQWEKFLNRNSHFRFATSRQASKFIRIAENKTFAKMFLIGETSIDGLNKGIADATPEQIEQAKAIEAEQEAKRQQAEAEKNRKAAEMEAKKAEQTKPKEPEIIEGEFKEIKPKQEAAKQEPVKDGFVQVQADVLEQMEDRYLETMSVNDSLTKEIESICKVFESNDQLTEAAKEIKRLTDINTALENRLNGHLNSYQNERRELINTLNHWKRRAEKAEKKLAELSHG